jgi:uncharacterized protein (TIGR02996 family)
VSKRSPRLEAILAHPASDQARAVYADELVEKGDPRGEFIHLQLATRRLDPDGDEHPRVIARADQLLDLHGEKWFANRTPHVRRGFAEWATGDDAPYLADEPLVGLYFSRERTNAQLRELAERRPRLERLTCGVAALDDETVSLFAEFKNLVHLRLFTFGMPTPALPRLLARPIRSLGLNAPLEAIAAYDSPLRVRVLRLQDPRVGIAAQPVAVLQILDGAELDALEVGGTAPMLEELLRWPGLPTLSRLRLREAHPRALASLAQLPLGVRSLEVESSTAIDASQLAALARAPWAASLRELRLELPHPEKPLVELVAALPKLTTLVAGPLAAQHRPERLVRYHERITAPLPAFRLYDNWWD